MFSQILLCRGHSHSALMSIMMSKNTVVTADNIVTATCGARRSETDGGITA